MKSIEREALRLALEALEQIDRAFMFTDGMKAITAIKAALEAHEALAQPKQEPVAQWQKRHIEQTDGMWCDTNEADAEWWLDQKTLHGWEVRKVYTTPPQRTAAEGEDKKTWIELTEDEFDRCDAHDPWQSMWNVAAMLKEKNT